MGRDGGSSSGGDAGADAAADAAAAASQLWRTAVDPRSGRTYYYHSGTRQSQWRKPPELATPRELEEARQKERQKREFFAAMEANILRSISRGNYCPDPSSSQAASAASPPSASSDDADSPDNGGGARRAGPPPLPPKRAAAPPPSAAADFPGAGAAVPGPLPLVRTISAMDENLLRELVRRVPSHRSLLGPPAGSGAGAAAGRAASASGEPAGGAAPRPSAEDGGSAAGGFPPPPAGVTAVLGPILELPSHDSSLHASSASASWYESSWAALPSGDGGGDRLRSEGTSGGELPGIWSSGMWNADPRDIDGAAEDDGRTSSSLSMTSLLLALPSGRRGESLASGGAFSSFGGNDSAASFGMDEAETLALRRLSEIADRMCGMEWEDADDESPASPLLMERFLSPMPAEGRPAADPAVVSAAEATSRSPGSESCFSLASTTDSVASSDPADADRRAPPFPLGSRYEDPIPSTSSDGPAALVVPEVGQGALEALGAAAAAAANVATKTLRSPKPAPIGYRRNTCGTLYVKSTMSAPDKDATIQCMCAVYRTHILQSLAEAGGNDDSAAGVAAMDEFAAFDDDASLAASRTSARASGRGSSRGHQPPPRPAASPAGGGGGAEPPTLDEVTRFFRHVFFRAKMEPDTIIMTLIYVERLIKCSLGRLRPRPRNWRSLLFCCAVLSSKVWDDMSMWNGDFTQVSPPGVRFSLQRINELEVRVLSLLNYNVKVPASEYAKYYFLMRSMLIKSGLGTSDDEFITPLDVDGAKRLQELTSSYSPPSPGAAPSSSSSSSSASQKPSNAGRAAGGPEAGRVASVPVAAMARSRSVGAPHYAGSDARQLSPPDRGAAAAAAPAAAPHSKKAGLEHVVKL